MVVYNSVYGRPPLLQSRHPSAPSVAKSWPRFGQLLGQGVSFDQGKVAAVRKWPGSPSHVELRKLFGLGNYSLFVDYYVNIAAGGGPAQAVWSASSLRNESEKQWGSAEQ